MSAVVAVIRAIVAARHVDFFASHFIDQSAQHGAIKRRIQLPLVFMMLVQGKHSRFFSHVASSVSIAQDTPHRRELKIFFLRIYFMYCVGNNSTIAGSGIH
jgi:hypothetical protein